MSAGDFGFLVAPCLAFLVAAGAPGPATLATAATSMASGRRAGLALGLGLSVGLALWGVAAAAGFGALVLSSAPALAAFRIVGGAYLLYLAWRSARAALAPSAPPAPAATGRLVRRGLALNATNPKAVLAWGAVIAVGLPADAGPGHLAAIVAACSALGVAVYAAYALAFSLPAVMGFYRRARRWIEGGLAALFAGAGLGLLAWQR